MDTYKKLLLSLIFCYAPIYHQDHQYFNPETRILNLPDVTSKYLELNQTARYIRYRNVCDKFYQEKMDTFLDLESTQPLDVPRKFQHVVIMQNLKQKFLNLTKITDKLDSQIYPNFPIWKEPAKQIKDANHTFKTFKNSKIIGHHKLIIDNFHKKSQHKVVLSICTPPKSGSSSFDILMRSLWKNQAIADQILEDKKMNKNNKFIPYLYRISNLLEPEKVFEEEEIRRKHVIFQKEFIANALFDSGTYRERQALTWTQQQFPIFDVTGRPTYRILNARHPFARLKSAFLDKFCDWPVQETSKSSKTKTSQPNFKPDFSSQKHNSDIHKTKKQFWQAAKKFETSSSILSKPNSCHTSFYAFLKFLIDGSGLSSLTNMHWDPMVDVCGACLTDFNVLTKLESIDYDFELIKQKFDFEFLGNFPNKRKSENGQKNLEETWNLDQKYEFMVANLVRDYSVLSLSDRQKLVSLYKYDFELFGYDPAPFLQ